GGLRDDALFARQQARVVDLFELDRRVALGFPDFFRAAASAALAGLERQDPEQRMDGVGRDVADERDAQQIAIVQQRRGFGDAALPGVRRRAFDQQRLRRDAD